MVSAKILTVYPNCSMGGMMTVYKNRIMASPDVFHHHVFHQDFGASRVYNALPNVRVDIVPKDRLKSFVQLAVTEQHYSEVRVTSLPDIANAIEAHNLSDLVYEFHSSDESVLKREIEQLHLDKLTQVWVPSDYLADVVRAILPPVTNVPVEVCPNLVDNFVFSKDGPVESWTSLEGTRPLIWVGRFDKGKNCRDFIRALSILPAEFVGVVIVSMENSPERMASFLADVASYKLQQRVRIMMNLAPEEIADLYRFARDSAGFFVSTSLGESFGYGVAEAMSTGLPVVAYDVGAIEERAHDLGDLSLVPVGDIHSLAGALVDWNTSFKA